MEPRTKRKQSPCSSILGHNVSWMGRSGVGAEWSKEQNKQTVRDARKDGPLLEKRDESVMTGVFGA